MFILLNFLNYGENAFQKVFSLNFLHLNSEVYKRNKLNNIEICISRVYRAKRHAITAI